jgi:uncharacterized Fe-S cluster protein YjdI
MPTKAYSSDEVVIRFDARRCIHAEACVRGLPSVFDARRRPWIQADAAGAEEIAAVVEGCPSGALTFERLDGGPMEEAPDTPEIRVIRDGPVYLRGSLAVTGPDGRVVDVGPRAALCRCGQSGNKPFCDNSHRKAGFEAP